MEDLDAQAGVDCLSEVLNRSLGYPDLKFLNLRSLVSRKHLCADAIDGQSRSASHLHQLRCRGRTDGRAVLRVMSNERYDVPTEIVLKSSSVRCHCLRLQIKRRKKSINTTKGNEKHIFMRWLTVEIKNGIIFAASVTGLRDETKKY